MNTNQSELASISNIDKLSEDVFVPGKPLEQFKYQASTNGESPSGGEITGFFLDTQKSLAVALLRNILMWETV